MIFGKGMNIIKANNRVLLKNIDIKTLTTLSSKPRTRVSFPVSTIYKIWLKIASFENPIITEQFKYYKEVLPLKDS